MPKPRHESKIIPMIENVCVLIIFSLLFWDIKLFWKGNLIIIVLLTSLVIWIDGCTKQKYWVKDKIYNIITLLGKYSYDVYIWHQIIIAFLYYSIFQTLNIYFVLCTICGTVILSLISVWMRNNIKLFSGNLKRILFSLIIVGVTSILSMIVYLRAGVVRDIPELDIYANNVHRHMHMHAEYNSIPYSWDKDFCEEDKINILVIGNSFARDFANILNESVYANYIEISYIYG